MKWRGSNLLRVVTNLSVTRVIVALYIKHIHTCVYIYVLCICKIYANTYVYINICVAYVLL